MKKHQTPSPKLQRNSKFQIPIVVCEQPAVATDEIRARVSGHRFGAWGLEFQWALELGVWILFGVWNRELESLTALSHQMGEGESSAVSRRIQQLWKLRERGLAVPSPVGRERVRVRAVFSKHVSFPH